MEYGLVRVTMPLPEAEPWALVNAIRPCGHCMDALLTMEDDGFPVFHWRIL